MRLAQDEAGKNRLHDVESERAARISELAPRHPGSASFEQERLHPRASPRQRLNEACQSARKKEHLSDTVATCHAAEHTTRDKAT